MKEVIVAEGQQDIVAIRRAVEAEIIITGGFGLHKKTLDKIALAYEKRGIIILTDPDRAGENIRAFLAERFPQAKHAFIPRSEACKNNDIGVEQADPESIRRALSKVHTHSWDSKGDFTIQDLVRYDLVGGSAATQNREAVAAELGLGYANAKQLLHRLNNYAISRQEFEVAVAKVGLKKQ